MLREPDAVEACALGEVNFIEDFPVSLPSDPWICGR